LAKNFEKMSQMKLSLFVSIGILNKQRFAVAVEPKLIQGFQVKRGVISFVTFFKYLSSQGDKNKRIKMFRWKLV